MTSFRQMLSRLYSRFLGKTGDDDEVTITFSPIPGQAHALYGLKKSKLADNSKGRQPKFTIESDDSSCDSDDDIQIDLRSDNSQEINADEAHNDERSAMARLCERLSGKG
jgi:hypothetical protein